MRNNRSKLLIALLLVIIVATGIVMPLHQARAAGWLCNLPGGIGVAWCGLDLFQEVVGFVQTGKLVSGTMTGTAASILNPLLKVTSIIPNEIPEVWKIVRNFVNLFFILVLIIMAFGTIFDIKKYTMKDMFVHFLIAALMVNFSFTIGNYILDVANDLTTVATKTIDSALNVDLWTYITTKGLSASKVSTVEGAQITEISKCVLGVAATAGLGSFLCAQLAVDVLLGMLFGIISVLAYIVVIIFLLIRIPAIWFYLIISPVAWLGLVMPGLKKVWTGWWEHFMGWTFWVPAYVGILMLLAIIIRGHGTASVGNGIGSISAVLGINDIIYFIVTIMFLVGGIWASFKVGKLFKGGAGWAAEKSQNFVKGVSMSLPTPIRNKETGNLMSIGDMAGGVRGTWNRIQEHGLPKEGPFGKFSWLYTGKEGAKKGEGKAAELFSKSIGFGPNLEGRKLEVEGINHELEELKNKITIGNTTLEEIKDEIDKEISHAQATGKSHLITPLGNINTELMAKYKFLAEKGAITKEQFGNVVDQVGDRNPLLVKDLAEISAKSNFRAMDEDDLMEIVAQAPGSPWAKKGARPLLKQVYQYLITDEGKKKAATKLNPTTFADGVKLFGGEDSNEGRGFIKEISKVRADLVAEYKLGTDYMEDRSTGKFADKDGIQYTREDALVKEYLDIFDGNSVTDIATVHEDAWKKPEFQKALEEKVLQMQGIDHTRAIDVSNVGDAARRGDRFYNGTGFNFRQALETALTAAKKSETKVGILKGSQRLNELLTAINEKAKAEFPRRGGANPTP